MKKLIVAIVILLALAVPVLAASPLATLINSFGDKVIVASGSSEAQDFFAKGYVLMGNPFQPKQCVCPDTGSAAGNTFDQMVRFNKNLVRGGSILNASTTLTTTRTLTAAEVCNNKTITVNSAAVAGTISVASLDLTIAATSSLFRECLKENGDEISFDFVNQSPTAATTTEIVAGTGCQIVYGVADGDAVIPGQKGATIEIKRIKDWLANGGTKDCIVKIYEWN